MKYSLLVTQWIPEELREKFSASFDFFCPTKQQISFTEEQLAELLPQCDGIFAVDTGVTKEMIDAAKRLRFITNHGVGYDAIDVAYATKKGIPVINTPHSVTESTAELAIALMMSLMRQIVPYDARVREDRWCAGAFYDLLGVEIFGKRLGIAGFGRIGRAVCRRAQALGMTVSYYNRHRLPLEEEQRLGVTYLPWEELLRQTDCLSLHMPLTPENYHLMDRQAFSLMKPTAYLINTARGAVVDEDAMLWALENGVIAGAGLDVFEGEPAVKEGIKACHKAVLTPHVGTQTYGVRIQMCTEALQGALDVMQGRPTDQLVNPEILG